MLFFLIILMTLCVVGLPSAQSSMFHAHHDAGDSSGSATVSLIEVALGQVDGYLGIGESTWDLMAALPILEQIGIHSTVDWRHTDLASKLRFACGTPEFLQAVASIIPYGTTLEPSR